MFIFIVISVTALIAVIVDSNSTLFLLQGIFTAILESAAMTFFTLEVASALPVYAVLPLMHVLLLLQILLDQWKPSKVDR